MKNILLVIAGPTASGKTAMAIRLAKHFKTEIISADSRQVFRELTIGTAKPSVAELQEVPHHFINTLSVSDNFNAGIFATSCAALLKKLFLKHPVVIMSGGSGLYIDAVLNNMDNFPEANQQLRNQLKADLEEKGLSYLQNQLKILDEITYNKIDRQNPQRLMRALEVCLVSGKPYSSFLGQPKSKLPFQVIYVCLDLSREALYTAINKRVDNMMENGLLNEVKGLQAYYHQVPMHTVGYKELIAFIGGEGTLELAVEKIKQHTRNYAKRQVTWFKKNKTIHWIKPQDDEKLILMVNEIGNF